VKPLVLFLKVFLLQRGLHETASGGMGSFLLVCTVISFLQRHEHAKNSDLSSRTTLGQYLLEFFRHYGHEFPYATSGISLKDGGALFERAEHAWAAGARAGQATLCVESPLDSVVDIGALCFKISILRASFTYAYNVLGSAFVSSTETGDSLLCPHLINPAHTFISGRPVIEASSTEKEPQDNPASKRRRLDAPHSQPALQGEQIAPEQEAQVPAEEEDEEDEDGQEFVVFQEPAAEADEAAGVEFQEVEDSAQVDEPEWIEGPEEVQADDEQVEFITDADAAGQ